MTADLEKVYGPAADSARERLTVLKERFQENFGPAEEGKIKFFTSP